METTNNAPVNTGRTADKLMTDYFKAVASSESALKSLARSQREETVAHDLVTSSILDNAEYYELLSVMIKQHLEAVQMSTDDMIDSNVKYQEALRKEIESRGKMVDFYSKMPDQLKRNEELQRQLEDRLRDKEENERKRNEQDEEEREHDKEHKEKKQGILKRIRTGLQHTAREGDSLTKRFAARGLLAGGGAVSGIMGGLMNQIPGIDVARSAGRTASNLVGDVRDSRRIRRQKREERKEEKQKTRPRATKESIVLQKQQERRHQNEEEQKENTEEQVKEQKKSNIFLDLIAKRLAFQMLFGLVRGVGSMFMTAFKVLGITAAVMGLTKLFTGLGPALKRFVTGIGNFGAKIARGFMSVVRSTYRGVVRGATSAFRLAMTSFGVVVDSLKSVINSVRDWFGRRFGGGGKTPKTTQKDAKGGGKGGRVPPATQPDAKDAKGGGKGGKKGGGAGKYRNLLRTARVGARFIPFVGAVVTAYEVGNLLTGGAFDDAVGAGFNKIMNRETDVHGEEVTPTGQALSAKEAFPSISGEDAPASHEMERLTEKMEIAQREGDNERLKELALQFQQASSANQAINTSIQTNNSNSAPVISTSPDYANQFNRGLQR